MFLNVLKSEFTKLRTTRAFWGNLIFFLLMTLGFNAFMFFMMAKFSEETQGIPVPPQSVAPGINMPGAMIIAIMSVIVVTSEYTHKFITMTFQATPNRVVLALAKLVLMMLVGGLLAFLVQLIGFPMAQLILGKEMGADLGLGNSEVQGYLWKSAVYAMMFVLFAQGLAWILRSAVAAIVIILGWYMALEVMVLPMIYKVGEKIVPYAPFKNLSAFYYGEPIEEVPWNEWGSLAYFGAWALVFYIIGLVLLVRRDA
ncbi:ABC-2 family transporter protein [Corynebacterium kalinowskii]|uniref:ABC-2 family transporter protein n=1 Tax=Corynebacterium kalinowskii TaxID=2675216 RepID=A0A6B8W0E7_9CORY|nr:ABC transporter permease subunit [Corynebacterium kalinowskii]QGU01218.1 ABC-2 family transporter protein [Corynebacterium kalinowskii]